MKCSRCNKWVSPGASDCPHCGILLAEDGSILTPAVATSISAKSYQRLRLAAALCGFAMLAFFYLLAADKAGSNRGFVFETSLYGLVIGTAYWIFALAPLHALRTNFFTRIAYSLIALVPSLGSLLFIVQGFDGLDEAFFEASLWILAGSTFVVVGVMAILVVNMGEPSANSLP